MTRILLPPGIGDGYWVAVKLAGFLRAHGIDRPLVYVDGMTPRRSEGLWRRVPFVEWGGYVQVPRRDPAFKRAYYHADYTVQPRAMGYDYFISFNGALRNGRSLDEGMLGPADWYLELVPSGEEDAARERFTALPPYVVAAFWERGNYEKWLREFPERSIVAMLDRVVGAGYQVVIMGAEFDHGSIADRLAARYTDMVGETSFDELMALVACSRGVIGFPAGNTLLGPYHRRPTLLLWNRYFDRRFWTNACPPNGTQVPIDTRGADPAAVADRFLQMINTESREGSNGLSFIQSRRHGHPGTGV